MNNRVDESNIPIAKLDETVEKLDDLNLFKNFAIATFNPLVKQCYHKGDPESDIARRVLLIKSSDSQISILNKQMLFWNTLGKLAFDTEERIQIGTPFKIKEDSDFDNIYAKIRLVPRNKFVDGENQGYRYIQVPHADPSKLGNLKNFTFRFGNYGLIYKFTDKREIKLRAYTEEEGHNAINTLLDLVLDKHKVGRSQEHSFPFRIPKDVGNGRLHGITADAKAIKVVNFGGVTQFTILI